MQKIVRNFLITICFQYIINYQFFFFALVLLKRRYLKMNM